MKKQSVVMLMGALLFFPLSVAFAEEKKQEGTVKVNAKDLAEIKRQVRLMRAEVAELDERIEQITAQHDGVLPKEQELAQEAKEDHAPL